MLRARVVTALVLIPITAGAVLLLDTSWVAAIAAAFLLIGAWEWTRMAGMQRRGVRFAYTGLVAAVLAACYSLRAGDFPWFLSWIAALGWLAAASLILACQLRRFDPARLRGRAVIGVFILVPVFSSVISLHAGPGPTVLLFLLILVWLADSAAFFAGRRWGRSALCSQVSPGKTVAGLYAALGAGLAAGLVYTAIGGMHGLDIFLFLLLCLVTVAASVVGDLMESLMKRNAGLKDSGSLLPGHGGMLDRIDSLTAAAPVFYAGVHLLGA